MNENYVNVEEKCFAYEESVVRNEVHIHTHTHTYSYIVQSGGESVRRGRETLFLIF